MSGLDLVTGSKKAFLSFFGRYNETTDEVNTDPCGNPEYKKIKLGSDKWLKRKAVKDVDGKINKYQFLEINLHND